MSGQVNGEGHKGQGEGQDSQVTTVNLEDLQKQLAELQTSNARLLEESKANKAKRQEIQALYDQEKQEKLNKTSNVEDKVKSLEEMLSKEKERSKSLAKKTLAEAIHSRVVQYAPNAYNHKDLLNQPDYANILKDGIDEESLSVSDDAVKAYVAKLQEEKPFLFKNAQSVGTFNKKPSAEMKQTKNEIPSGKDEILKLLNEKWGTEKSLF